MAKEIASDPYWLRTSCGDWEASLNNDLHEVVEAGDQSYLLAKPRLIVSSRADDTTEGINASIAAPRVDPTDAMVLLLAHIHQMVLSRLHPAPVEEVLAMEHALLVHRREIGFTLVDIDAHVVTGALRVDESFSHDFGAVSIRSLTKRDLQNGWAKLDKVTLVLEEGRHASLLIPHEEVLLRSLGVLAQTD